MSLTICFSAVIGTTHMIAITESESFLRAGTGKDTNVYQY